MVENLISRMERWLAANRPTYLARLQPGVDSQKLAAFEDQFAIVLPETFRSLYRWRNGQEVTCTESFEKNFMFSPLEEIAGTKANLDGMIGTDFEDPNWWRRGWLPFLHNGAGDYLCVDLAGDNAGCPGQLLVFYHDWEKRPVKFPNLDAWLTSLVNSMENGTLKLV